MNILIKFSTGNLDDDWDMKRGHIPAIGAIVMPPWENRRTYRVMDHVWPSGDRDNYVMLHVSEIVEAIAEPEPETEAENETV